MRISIADLEANIAHLNEITGHALEPYSRGSDGSYSPNPGNYHLSQAYGGCCVVQMASKGSGVSCPIHEGHLPKRECYALLRAFIRGIDLQARALVKCYA